MSVRGDSKVLQESAESPVAVAPPPSRRPVGCETGRAAAAPAQRQLQGRALLQESSLLSSRDGSGSDIKNGTAISIIDEPWLGELDENCNAVLCEITQNPTGHWTVRTSRFDTSELTPLDSNVTHNTDDRSTHNDVQPTRDSLSQNERREADDPKPGTQIASASTQNHTTFQPGHHKSTRLLLIEGLSKDFVQTLRSQGFDLPSSFCKRHIQGAESTVESSGLGQILHLKWLRLAYQSKRQWDLGQVTPPKGRSKWRRAPVGHGIVFEQCRCLPAVHRSHETLDNCLNTSTNLRSENQYCNEYIVMATEQMCSAISLGSESNTLALDGIVLFDASRRYAVARKMGKLDGLIRMPAETMDSFYDFESDQQRFLTRLQDCQQIDTSSDVPAGTFENVLMTMACDDQLEVLSKLIDTLDKIDLKMAHDNVVQEFNKDWRGLFGTWRVHLNHTDRFIGPMKTFKDHNQHQQVAGQPSQNSSVTHFNVKDSMHGETSDVLAKSFMEVESKSQSALKRCEATFSALMSTMTIIESQMAIREAAQVSKLTKLAFFFIPLTFVSSIFGMNIAQFDGASANSTIGWWVWTLTSVLLLLVTYIVLYFCDAMAALSSLVRTPSDKLASHLWFFKIVFRSLGWRRGLSVAGSYVLHRSIRPTGPDSQLVNVTVRLRRSDEGETTEFDIDKL